MPYIAAILFAISALAAIYVVSKRLDEKDEAFHIRINKNEVIYWNLLPKKLRYWGYREDWIHGPVPCFGFWFFHFYIWWKEK
ncbi:hypothetical protein [Pantoea trifolii]|uniref:hypothetical protein n=1 Tax=Candidatus Pantoea symbiotica TaxID=1884370 RepID=UPI002413C280|nr:hypothetical protein [Pantoea rodasii]